MLEYVHELRFLEYVHELWGFKVCKICCWSVFFLFFLTNIFVVEVCEKYLVLIFLKLPCIYVDLNFDLNYEICY